LCEGLSHSFVHLFDFLTADSGCAAILDVGLKVLTTDGHSWAFRNGESLVCGLRAGGLEVLTAATDPAELERPGLQFTGFTKLTGLGARRGAASPRLLILNFELWMERQVVQAVMDPLQVDC
jgi:hypothetical protein